MIYEFGNDVLKCKVSSVGAELVSVLHEGRERLWQNETGGWAGHAPILFPHGGKCAIQVNGKLCSFQLHGIVMKREFSLVENTGDTITLCLHANEETKAL